MDHRIGNVSSPTRIVRTSGKPRLLANQLPSSAPIRPLSC
jgi:hypothetical protein